MSRHRTGRGRHALIVLCLAVAALLAGCAGADDPDPAPTAEPTPTPTETTDEGPDTDGTEDGGGGALPAPLQGVVIALDPGHNGGNAQAPEEIARPVDAGGFDKPCNTTGTVTDDGVSESAINLAVALELAEQLRAYGATVELTRDDDDGVGPCVDERGRFAEEVGADLLLSLHADGGPADGYGFHVIHPSPTRSVAAPEVVVDAERLATAVRDSLRLDGFEPSTYAGQQGLDERDDLGTLNLAAVPAVMLEAGNLRHPDDAAMLSSPDGQLRLVQALVAAIISYTAIP